MLDNAFDALKTYDWGMAPSILQPIDDAIVATHGDAASRRDLESRLADVLKTDTTRDARDFVCRKLMVIGTAASVPALATLLTNSDSSHMARYALERIPTPEAAAALRDALSEVNGELKVGMISSLGVRQDEASVAALAGLLSDPDIQVAQAAAYGLGDIRSAKAAKALASANINAEAQSAVTDASLSCAEGLLAAGQKNDALAIYKRFAGGDHPKHVRLAATRGVLACAGK